ncbi:MAG: L-aspartate oxidase [Phycisphaerales bacterium]|nr:L-aspartate oxidase [Phycisphaerales bacterium]
MGSAARTTCPAPRPVIVGTGIAGLWTAWRLASEGVPSVVVTKGSLTESASAWAQGGIAAALGPGDSPGRHAADTLAAADGLADPEAVRILTQEGPARVLDLLDLGATFDRNPDGRLGLALEAAHSRPRILHAGGDRTGAAVIGCLARWVGAHPAVEIMEQTEVSRLMVASGRVTGVHLLSGDGARLSLPASAVVLATGGIGQLFAVTTNPPVATADGWSLAHGAGAQLRDIEFLQFHPTALKLRGVNPAPLISEAVRGAGAVLVDRAGRRFALALDPRGELAPRDVVARAVAAADAGGGAWLDARRVDAMSQRFPGITAMLLRCGLDPARDLLPVAPAMHYAMGGIVTDLQGRTDVPGLWAVGEAARTGAHGANRLASNSLLEGLVFADRAGRSLARLLGGRVDRIGASPCPGVPDHASDAGCEGIRQEMRAVMTANVGVERTEVSLTEAEAALQRLARATPPDAWRTRNQIGVAGLIAAAARRRRESRGGHWRTDFPRRVLREVI